MPQPSPLRVLVICPDEVLRGQATDALEASGNNVVQSHSEESYPSGGELARLLRGFSPQVVFLSFEQWDTAVAVMRFLESEAEGLPVVGIHRIADAAVMREAMRAGVREYLIPPFRADRLQDALLSIRALLRRDPLSYVATDHIYSLLPAKPGVGTSTVALNVSAALAREPGMKVLLTDLDLSCGILRFLLKLPQDLSIVDALARSEDLDSSLWPQLVARRDGIDILHSGGVNPHAYLDPPQVQGLIDFARGAYNGLFFDMSGNMEHHSLQVMEESKRVFVVCNPEPGSLSQGREKVQFLQRRGLGGRLAAIINRGDQRLAVPAAKAAEFLGIPVAAVFQNNYHDVTQSVAEGCSVVGGAKGSRSRLAREYRAFAKLLLENARNSPTEEEAAMGMACSLPQVA